MTGRGGFGLIPTPAKVLAALAFLVITALFFWLFDGLKAIGFGTAIGAGVAAIASISILLAGYIFSDASRRGMPPVPWIALALLIPNGVGFVLYFLLRKPILHPCPNCGSGVAGNAAFCSKCGQPQASTEARGSPKNPGE